MASSFYCGHFAELGLVGSCALTGASVTRLPSRNNTLPLERDLGRKMHHP